VKQFPNLTLVTKEDPEAGSEEIFSSESSLRSRFELVGIDELPASDQSRVQQQVTELFPKASIIAVARNARSWDLRPVVARVGDSEPSIVRFANPEVLRSSHLAVRLKENFERLRSLKELNSAILGWGVWAGELWYRRPLVEKTLGHILSASDPIAIEHGLHIAHALVEEVVRWHERGIVHGHITSSNVIARANNKIALADAGVGLCAMQAQKGVSDYPLQSFAPETIGNQHPVFSADLYGLGLVFRRLFVVLNKRAESDERRGEFARIIAPVGELGEALLEADPARRPPLAQVRRTIVQALDFYSSTEKKVKPKGRPTNAIQGKILRPGSGESTPGSFTVADQPTPGLGETGEGPLDFTRQSASQEVPRKAPQSFSNFSGERRDEARIQGQSATASPFEESSRPPLSPRADERHVVPQQILPESASYVPQAVFVQPVYTAQPYGMPPQYVAQGYPPFDPRVGPAIPGMSAYGNQPGPQPNYGQPPMAPTGPTERSTSVHSISLGWIITLVVCVLGFWFYRVHGFEIFSQSHEREDLQAYRDDWNSKIPSRMVPVAVAAVSHEGDPAAESVILASIRSGEVSSAGVNVGLLRIAFDDRWEMELSPADRRTALALGLGNLLRQNFPKDLTELDRLHPGVLLALTASVGQVSANDYFRNVPADRLVQLPPPFGPAFREIVSAHPAIHCDDEAVQRLARLGTRGVNLDDLAMFLRDETAVRLRALALILSHDNSRAQTALDLLLRDSNINLNDTFIDWGRAFHLDQWQELESSDRLFVLAGVAPAGKVSADNLGRLLSHPVPSLRAYAIRGALSSIRMKHPGAVPVLSELEKVPQTLSGEQTVDLVKFLINPAEQKSETVRAWFETNPPREMAAQLLLATAKEHVGTILDTSLAVYLKGKNWKPGIDTLRKLSFHPDAYTRLFAYSEIYLLSDREVATEFLRDARRQEADPENKLQLDQMLLDVTH